MTSNLGSGPGSPSSRLLRIARLAGTILLCVLLALGAYYVLYIQKKESYLVGRNFRLLETLGEEISGAAAGYGQFLASGSGLEIDGLVRLKQCDPGAQPAQNRASILWWPRNTSRITIAAPLKGVCADLDPRKLFPAPRSGSKPIFDGMLLARKDGDVVYTDRLAELGITQLAPLLKEEKSKPVRVDGKENDSILTLARHQTVWLGDRKYRLFLEPITLPIGENPQKQTDESWILGGLVLADDFTYKTMAIPSSSLLGLLAALLLTILSWPMVRLRLIGERQRVRIADVFLIGMCTLLGTTILSLSLFDFYAYSELRGLAQDQVRKFALLMKDNFIAEIQAAHAKLQALEDNYREEARFPVPTTAPDKDPQCRARRREDSSDDSWRDFELIGHQGEQLLKILSGNSDDQCRRIPVGDRDYFKRVDDYVHEPLRNTLWTLPEAPKGANPFYYLQFVTARTTHDPEAMLSEPPERRDHSETPGYDVAALGIRLRSLIDPITPPSFEFAVIDDKGKVLFHSDLARIDVESFFVEADQNERLRSAVFARRQEEMSIRYFGEDYMISLQPIQDSVLTIVALRSEEELRALNMEWVVTTALFLLLATSPMFVLALAVILARPGYRAPWVWPDLDRPAEYLVLTVVLSLQIVAFRMAIYHLSNTLSLLVLAWSLPLLALLTSYAHLQGKAIQGSPRWLATLGGYALLLGVLFWALYIRHGKGDRTDFLLVAGTATLIVLTCILSTRDFSWKRRINELHPPLAIVYPLAGLALLLVTVVLPTRGVFKAVHDMELASYVRHGQLTLARSLGKKTLDRRFYGSPFFATQVREGIEDREDCPKVPPSESSPIPEFLETLLPHYSLYTSEMLELLHERSGDCSWDAHPVKGDALELHNRLDHRFFLSHLSATHPTEAKEPPQHRFFLPSLTLADIADWLLSLALKGVFLAILFRLMLFIAQRLFLVDLLDPLLSSKNTLPALIPGRNTFVVEADPLRKSRLIAGYPDLTCLDLSSLDAGPAGEEAWEQLRLKALDCEGDVLILGLDHGTSSSAFSAWKICFLEELVRQRQRTTYLQSAISAERLLACERRRAAINPSPAGSQPAEELLRSILDGFTVADSSPGSRRAGKGRAHIRGTFRRLFGLFRLLRHRKFHKLVRRLRRREMYAVLLKESAHDPFLISVGQGVRKTGRFLEREQLLEELGERAEGYYRAIWDRCTGDEKIVLQHLAQEGLVNPKNRRVVRRLMARRLIRRCPNFCLMNESFRRFLLSPDCRSKTQELETDASPSAWDRFQWPFFATLGAGFVFFFATQQELLDSTTVLVTGLTAGLPTVTKIIDLLGGRKPGDSAGKP
jgi:hypothetical protein